jgi:presenilin-like A22 family membrane protease
MDIIFLSLISIILSVIVYFLLGVNIPGCARFNSIPFGGCGYSDQTTAINLIFWFCVILSIILSIKLVIKKHHNRILKK